MENTGTINIGGINGLGEGLVNTNSKEFKELKYLTKKISTNQTEEEKIENEFLSIRIQMEAYINGFPENLILAGTFIEKFLTAIQIKKKDFANYIGYEESNLSALLKGRRRINSDVALKLGKIFKLNPLIWLNIESKNELIREIKGREDLYGNYSLEGLLKKVV